MKASIRQQYQDRTEQAREFANLPIPREGWIRTVRKALGMSGGQLAVRLGLGRAQVSQMERMEPEGRITLKQLRRVADVLNCELTYALVPREPVADQIRRRAEDVARSLVERVNINMKLEAQDLSDEALHREIQLETERLIREMPRDLWQD